MSEINFLSQRQITVGKTEAVDKRYRYFATLGFIGALVIFFIAAGANFFLTTRLKQANAKGTALTNQIRGDESVETAFLIFSQKLKSVREIYENRSNKQQAIDFFSNLFGEQVFLSGMNYGGEGNELTLQLTSSNVFTLENMLTALDSESVRENFSSVTKRALRRDELGSYSLDLAVELKKEGER